MEQLKIKGLEICEKRRIKSVILSLLMLFLVLGNTSKVSAQETLIPYRKGKLWGLADTSGKMAIEPRYDSMFNPSFKHKTYFMVTKNRKTGLISGVKEVLPTQHFRLQYAGGTFVRSQIEGEKTSAYNSSIWRYFTLGDGKLLSKDTIRNTFSTYGVNLNMPMHYKLIEARLKNKRYHLFLMDMNKQVLVQQIASNLVSSGYFQIDRNNVRLIVETDPGRKTSYALSYNSSLKQIEKRQILMLEKEDDNEEIAEIEDIYDVDMDVAPEKPYSRKKKEGKVAEIVKFGFDSKNLVMKTYLGRYDRMGKQFDEVDGI